MSDQRDGGIAWTGPDVESDARLHAHLRRLPQLLRRKRRGSLLRDQPEDRRAARLLWPRAPVRSRAALDGQARHDARAPRRSDPLEEASADLRQLDVGPLSRGADRRADRQRVPGDAERATTHLSGADEAGEAWMHDWVRWSRAGALGEALPSNIWIGVSTEDQKNANERIPWLLATPAHVRFVSAEPLIGPIDFSKVYPPGFFPHDTYAACASRHLSWRPGDGAPCLGDRRRRRAATNARPFDVEWARSIVRQCRYDAGAAPCLVKQLGGKPFDSTGAWESRDVLPCTDRRSKSGASTFGARGVPR